MTRFKLVRLGFALIFFISVLCGPWMAELIGDVASVSPQGVPFAPSEQVKPLGTDHLGRPVFGAILHGGQSLLLTAIIGGTLTTIFAAILGSFGALYPRLGVVIDTLADAIILVPSVILMLLLTVIFPEAGIWLLILTVAFLGTPYAARVCAAGAHNIVGTGYVQAAQSMGEPSWRIVVKDIIPNMSHILRSVWGLRIIEALYLLAIASFLGVGSSLGRFAWSTMVNENAQGILLNPWAVVAPVTLLGLSSVVILSLLGAAEATEISSQKKVADYAG
ncbi:Oligopeptide transport system permease protein OppC [Corynebacterium diphtheriae subsp. lausannense]|uniref:ABC transporter permease n=1 Tax=Corynebacterium belfantii TaxID=2014537 RepID=UPI000DC1ED18|nr:ABC transporter permease subunit [Corynebacterium belfantii]MBG9299028.1 ABC transporter permease [Corynebacterium belfantii]MBG9308514.1 ABC transporter permease [Corynebacterium belfantii]SPJ41764.1 Oligopeptide transport system permease protein OppC [Corynebacterium diphtheriae subsp. lausannense]